MELKVKDKMKPKFFIKTVLNKSFQVENDVIFQVKKLFFVVIGIVKNFFLSPGPDKPEPKRTDLSGKFQITNYKQWGVLRTYFILVHQVNFPMHHSHPVKFNYPGLNPLNTLLILVKNGDRRRKK